MRRSHVIAKSCSSSRAELQGPARRGSEKWIHTRGRKQTSHSAMRVKTDVAQGQARSPEHDRHLPQLRLENPRRASCHDEARQRELVVCCLEVQPAACQLHLVEYTVAGARFSQCLGRVVRIVRMRANSGELTCRTPLSLCCCPSPIRSRRQFGMCGYGKSIAL